MKLFNVMKCSDPYEADGTLAVCTSLESAKKLFPKRLLQHVKGSERAGKSSITKGSDWINLNTGEKEFVLIFPGRPYDPYIEEIESDVKL